MLISLLIPLFVLLEIIVQELFRLLVHLISIVPKVFLDIYHVLRELTALEEQVNQLVLHVPLVPIASAQIQYRLFQFATLAMLAQEEPLLQLQLLISAQLGSFALRERLQLLLVQQEITKMKQVRTLAKLVLLVTTAPPRRKR